MLVSGKKEHFVCIILSAIIFSQAPYDPEWNAGPEGRYGWMYSVRHYASQVLLNYLEQAYLNEMNA